MNLCLIVLLRVSSRVCLRVGSYVGVEGMGGARPPCFPQKSGSGRQHEEPCDVSLRASTVSLPDCLSPRAWRPQANSPAERKSQALALTFVAVAVLQDDGDNVRALHRRCQANLDLDDVPAAQTDLHAILRLTGRFGESTDACNSEQGPRISAEEIERLRLAIQRAESAKYKAEKDLYGKMF